jgi:hypothetical protein
MLLRWPRAASASPLLPQVLHQEGQGCVGRDHAASAALTCATRGRGTPSRQPSPRRAVPAKPCPAPSLLQLSTSPEAAQPLATQATGQAGGAAGAAALTVGELRGDDQHALAARLHGGYALSAQDALRWVAAVRNAS